MYVQLRTLPSNIAYLVKPITTVQPLSVPQRMQPSNIVTRPISCTIHILITATLSLLHLQFLPHITMRSIVHRQNHTTIKSASYVHPAHPPLLISTLTIQAVMTTIVAAVLLQRNIAAFFRKPTTHLRFIVHLKIMKPTQHLKNQCLSKVSLEESLVELLELLL
jgi:hypothetical protein